MYICICKGITEQQVLDAVVSRSTNNPKEILKTLGVGSDCGTCVEDAVKTLLNQSSLKPFKLTDTSNNS
jgi:bacterioferritin-associated ferredoxin